MYIQQKNMHIIINVDNGNFKRKLKSTSDLEICNNVKIGQITAKIVDTFKFST